MFLSYIYSISGADLDVVKKTINSLLNQSKEDCEIILVSDTRDNSQEVNDFIRNVFWENKNCKYVENSTPQGVSVSWNIGIEIAEGEYITFINNTDFVGPKHFETIKKTHEKHGSVEVFEYSANLAGLAESSTKTFIKKETIYNLEELKEPFAYINDFVECKTIKLSLIKKRTIKFRRFVRYDMLFIFKCLGQANDYLYIDSDPLVNIEISEANYSIFDIVNQWPHIFNYYRRINKFKEVSEFLNYAYYKMVIHNWLWVIKKYQNKTLMKKSIAFATRKFNDKKLQMITTNSIFKERKDKAFAEIVENFSKWTRDLLRAV